MRRATIFASLATLLGLAPACIIGGSDDSSNDSSNEGAPSTGATAVSSGASGSGSASASGSGSASGSASVTGNTSSNTSTADGDSGEGGACGWGQTGDDKVPEGYICGGNGADPGKMFPMGCPEGAALEVGAECREIEGPGCCDADGNVWYCGNNGSGPALARIEC